MTSRLSCCASLLDRLACTGRQKANELKVFDTEPLIKPTPHQHVMSLSFGGILNITSNQITDLLYKFLLHEYHRAKFHERQTHFLGSELSDRFFCLFCDNDKQPTYIQYEISNAYFDNVWNGNQYIVQYVCVACAKRLQKQLVKTIAHVHEHVYTNQSRLIFQILMRHKIPVALQPLIRSFLPHAFVSIKCITHHKAPFRDQQSSDWVEEQMIH